MSTLRHWLPSSRVASQDGSSDDDRLVALGLTNTRTDQHHVPALLVGGGRHVIFRTTTANAATRRAIGNSSSSTVRLSGPARKVCGIGSFWATVLLRCPEASYPSAHPEPVNSRCRSTNSDPRRESESHWYRLARRWHQTRRPSRSQRGASRRSLPQRHARTRRSRRLSTVVLASR